MRRRKEMLKLAEELLNVPEEKFDMGTWGKGGNRFKCGTAACAMGWYHTLVGKDCVESIQASKNGQLHYKDYTSYEAVAAYFQIKQSEAIFLFQPRDGVFGNGAFAAANGYSYVYEDTREAVSARIIRFCNRPENLPKPRVKPIEIKIPKQIKEQVLAIS